MAWVDRMQYWFSGLLADEQLLAWAFVIGLGLLAFVLSLWFLALIRQLSDPVKHRIDVVAAELEGLSAVDARSEGGSRPGGGPTQSQELLERLGRGLTPVDAEKRGRVVSKLVMAGYRSPRAVYVYFGAKVVALLALPLAIILVALLSGKPALSSAVSFAGMALPIGLLLPDYWLVRRVRRRQSILRRSLPDALDMLVVCTEAGLGLNAAFQRVVAEMGVQHPELSIEFGMMMLQIRAGMESRAALQDLVLRTGMEEIRALVATLLQAMRFGTSIAETLRAYAEEMREKRLQAAEEEAAKVGVKMIIPIALFLLPGFMLIVLGPPLINLMKSLGGGG